MIYFEEGNIDALVAASIIGHYTQCQVFNPERGEPHTPAIVVGNVDPDRYPVILTQDLLIYCRDSVPRLPGRVIHNEKKSLTELAWRLRKAHTRPHGVVLMTEALNLATTSSIYFVKGLISHNYQPTEYLLWLRLLMNPHKCISEGSVIDRYERNLTSYLGKGVSGLPAVAGTGISREQNGALQGLERS